MTSPAVCISGWDSSDFKDCKIYYLTDNKKYDIDFDNICGDLHVDYNTNEQRYYNITQWVLSLLRPDDKVYLEGYSLGSTGMVFNIAENAGLLKHYLWKSKYDFYVVAPTVIKKFATGKGNANKELLQQVFEQQNNYSIKQKLEMTEKQWNPSSDIIDSYFICKYGHYDQKEVKND